MIPVSRDLVEVSLCHQRCTCSDIAPLIILKILYPALKLHDHLGSLWCKKRKSLTNDINGCK